MKRILSITIMILLATSAIVFSATTIKNISVSPNTATVKVDGRIITADNFNYNGTIYVPLRAVSESLGKNVTWDNDTKTALIFSDTFTPDNILDIAKNYWELYQDLEGALSYSEAATKIFLTPSLQKDSYIDKVIELNDERTKLIGKYMNSKEYLSIPTVNEGYRQCLLYLSVTSDNLQNFKSNRNWEKYHSMEMDNMSSIYDIKNIIASTLSTMLEK